MARHAAEESARTRKPEIVKLFLVRPKDPRLDHVQLRRHRGCKDHVLLASESDKCRKRGEDLGCELWKGYCATLHGNFPRIRQQKMTETCK